MTLIAIAAIGLNRELGKDNDLLWHLPRDFKFFKETTRGHSVIMGRKTYDSMGKALPKRRNIVLSRNTQFSLEDAEVFHSIEQILEATKNEEQVYVIGGAEIYKLFMPHLNKLLLTHVDGSFDKADTFFPSYLHRNWKKTKLLFHPKDEKHQFAFEVTEYQAL